MVRSRSASVYVRFANSWHYHGSQYPQLSVHRWFVAERMKIYQSDVDTAMYYGRCSILVPVE
jgi:hypothetical protein